MAVSDEYLRIKPKLEQATSLVVNGGFEPFDPGNRRSNAILAKTEDPKLISSAISGLTFVGGERMDWMTPGAPTFVFLDGRRVVAAVRCLLPGYVRCEELWDGDVKLADGAQLVELLIEFASNSITARMMSNQPSAAAARAIRSSYQLSPTATFRALRRAGLSYVDSKTAVDSTLSANEATATQSARIEVEEALCEE